MFKLATRLDKVKPSATLAVTQKAAELRAAGKDIIGLGAGEPDFDTPEHIKEAAIQAIRDGFTKYTAVDGLPEAKQAVQFKFKRDNGLDFDLDQIILSTGGKQCLYNLCQAYLNEGDEVIVPAPYWVSYPDMVLLAGGVPVIVTAGIEQGFKITPEQLKSALNSKTRLIFLNSPSNPTGVAYSQGELKALAGVLKDYPEVLIATDDMYEHILWSEEPFSNICNAAPELFYRTVVFNGVSKAYSMTGWRIGYAGGPAEIIKAMKKVQSQSTSNPTAISQKAAEAALKGPLDCVQMMLKAFKERHDFVYQRLSQMAGVRVQASDGTFYIFPDFSEIITKLKLSDDVELTKMLLETAGVALVPGSAFGMPGCARISYATSLEKLEAALSRIEKTLA